jgi:hypothetical protein
VSTSADEIGLRPASRPSADPGARPGARRFVAAVPADDAPLRALLRATPSPGRVRLVLEREPAFLPRDPETARAVHTFVCRESESGPILGLAQRSLLPVWFEGRRRALGYLSHLRRAPGVAPTRALLQAGFEACESTRRAGELAFDLTSILEENRVAQRLLERGLPGLPRYELLCRFVTRTLEVGTSARRAASRAPAGIEIHAASAADGPELADFLARTRARHALAGAWSPEGPCAPGPAPRDFLLARRGARLIGCAALWDQRNCKQTVVHGYAGGLELVRRLLGPVARLCGRRPLPAPGSVLALAFLAYLALEEEPEGAGAAELHAALVRAALGAARERRLRYVVTGFAEGHPLLSAARAEFRARELASRLYRVHPCGHHASPAPSTPRLEVALL